MSADIPTTEPTSLRAGDTWAWRREDLSDYPASGWTLVYHFRNASTYFDVTAAADGDAYAVSVAKASTGKTPGWYDWVAVVTDTGNTERYEVDRGRVEILANYAAAAVLDGRSWARKMLDYIESALLSRATADQLDLVNATLADRGIQRDKAGLITLRSQFKAEVAREEHAEAIRQGLGGKNRLLVRFS